MKTKPGKPNNQTVATLDISRFMGTWYEIARYDQYFEKGMTHVTATYSLKLNGKIKVVNAGYKNGKPKQITGKAYQPDPSDPGKLKVSFFLWFYSDYYILELDPDYRYVIIGSSSEKYLWIMSRTSTLPDAVCSRLLQNLKDRGYDTDKLVFVSQEVS